MNALVSSAQAKIAHEIPGRIPHALLVTYTTTDNVVWIFYEILYNESMFWGSGAERHSCSGDFFPAMTYTFQQLLAKSCDRCSNNAQRGAVDSSRQSTIPKTAREENALKPHLSALTTICSQHDARAMQSVGADVGHYDTDSCRRRYASFRSCA